MDTKPKRADHGAASVLVVMALATALAAPAAGAQHHHEGGKIRDKGITYFVDCAHGSDAWPGTSRQRPWRTLSRVNSVAFQPGDSIRFRRSTRCTGTLAPIGSGALGAPIVVDAYGKGSLPRIEGGGARATVVLQGIHGWELHDLDVSNQGPPPEPGKLRTGVLFLDGTGDHYVVENVRLHDIDSASTPPVGDTNYQNYSKQSGGIIFQGGSYGDVVLEGNSFDNVDREGIYVGGSSPTDGVVIRDNALRQIGGDGIVVDNSTGALVEHNLVDGFNTQGAIFNAGVWAYDSTDAVFQFNDVSHGQHGPLDSMAYDIDGANFNLTFQYNLSHDNSGGFLMVCNNVGPFSSGQDNGGSVVRYNISQNDYGVARGVVDAPFVCASAKDIGIYNNTIYTRDPRVTSMVENTAASDLRFINNIFVGPSPQATIFDQDGIWDANLYFDVSCVERPADPHAVVANPRFVGPGTAASLDDADGYRLRPSSPALGTGVQVPDNGGRDYYGNPVPQDRPPNIGAYQGPGVAAPVPPLEQVVPPLAPGC